MLSVKEIIFNLPAGRKKKMRIELNFYFLSLEVVCRHSKKFKTFLEKTSNW